MKIYPLLSWDAYIAWRDTFQSFDEFKSGSKTLWKALDPYHTTPVFAKTNEFIQIHNVKQEFSVFPSSTTWKLKRSMGLNGGKKIDFKTIDNLSEDTHGDV